MDKFKKIFKKYFIPHLENSYKPHLFQEAGIAMLLAVVISLFALAVSGRFFLTYTDLTALVLPKVLVDYTNENRSKENYGHLAVSPVLEKAAQLKANDMAEKSYFAHKSPEGKSPWYWFKQAGYDFSYAGENLAVNFDDSVDVSRAWMNSPGHRANIMNGNFTEIGIATAEGMYQGRRTVFVVQLFGRPALPANIVVKKAPVTATKTTTSVVKSTTTPGIAGSSSTTESVLSESVYTEAISQNGENELFISVKTASADIGTTTVQEQSNWLERIIASPLKFLSLSYLAVAMIIIVSLLLMVSIEVRKQHPKHIFIAFGILALILILLYVYESVLFAPLLVV